MKYRLKVYYRTPVMDKVTGYMQQIFDDWKRTGKRLEACRIFEFETEVPLSQEVIAKLKALKKDWMDAVELEEVKEFPGTWKCHICSEERPDDKISVLTKPLIINGQVVPGGGQNIRYCNDQPTCIEGAKEFSFFKAGKEG